MKLSFVRLVLGPLQNNVYLLGDEDTKNAVVIDPSFDSEQVITEANRQGWILHQVWLTHAHFDHVVGVDTIRNAFDPPLPVGMHKDTYAWTKAMSASKPLGLPVLVLSEPELYFSHGQLLPLMPGGQNGVVEVREAPGHNPGSVIFFCPALEVCFCGDVIFRESIGRTDLPGGDYAQLISSIREQVFSLPESTTLLPGHGPQSSVGYERQFNPYLA